MNAKKKSTISTDTWQISEPKDIEHLLQMKLPWIRDRIRKRMGPKLRRMLESSDMVQETVLQFLQYAPNIMVSDDQSFRALMARIIENILRDKNDWFSARRRDLARERPRASPTTLSLNASRPPIKTPSKIAIRHENEAFIRLGLEMLDTSDREVIILRQWDRHSFAEIAELLGISSDAARIRFNRAMMKLSQSVGKLRRGEHNNLSSESTEDSELDK